MAFVIGQIGTLKELKKGLIESGITRFNSVGGIQRFIQEFEEERKSLISKHTLLVHQAKDELSYRLSELNQVVEDKTKERTARLNYEMETIRKKLSLRIFRIKVIDNLLNALIFNESYKRYRFLERNWKSELYRPFRHLLTERNDLARQFEGIQRDITAAIEKSAEQELRELIGIRKRIDELSLFISGAIGEQKVVDMLKKLPDDFTIINDFKLTFMPPLFNKRENDRIFSIQADHLVVCRAGVFIIETKNWSKQSVERLDLFSPANQVKTGYALYSVLNKAVSNSRIQLHEHHWGDKKIAVKNIITMIGNKPAAEFQHVKLLSLPELLGYICYFENVYSATEAKNIATYLQSIMSKD